MEGPGPEAIWKQEGGEEEDQWAAPERGLSGKADPVN